MAPIVWTPSPKRIADAHITTYLEWLAAERGVAASTYNELWRWSVTEIEQFWSSIWDYFQVRGTPYQTVLQSRDMPGAQWFPGTRLNYAEHALRRDDDHPAIVFENETGRTDTLSYAQLGKQVSRVATWLRGIGVGPGDRVVGLLPNIPETVIAFLAAASIGATWSCCSPDFGVRSVVDRFAQIEPTVLIAVDGYTYGGKAFDRRDHVAQLRAALPTLRATVIVANLSGPIEGCTAWDKVIGTLAAELDFVQMPFDHPLWILYTSGTTGMPKGVMHGHGGMLLEQLRSHSLHLDIGAGDVFFWYGSTGWAVWNVVVGALLCGATILLYDGDPAYPDLSRLWRFTAAHGVTFFGISPPFVQAMMREGLRPREVADLSVLRTFGSTGAPLTAEAYSWVYGSVGDDLMLASLSGGTDICSGFVGPCPLLPVRAGEMQCRWLGCAVESWSADGEPLIGEVGELVVTEPIPAMPTMLWGDADGSRYRASYFEPWPGAWRQGDWVRIEPEGGVVISGRSDSTLKRAGVRMGTAELYAIVESIDGVSDSLVVDTSHAGADGRLVLFVVPAGDFDEALRRRIVTALREQLSPRHVPDEIHEIAAVPRTLNGKKLEIPVKKLLLGADPSTAISLGALANPESLDAIVAIAEQRTTSGAPA